MMMMTSTEGALWPKWHTASANWQLAQARRDEERAEVQSRTGHGEEQRTDRIGWDFGNGIEIRLATENGIEIDWAFLYKQISQFWALSNS